MCLQRLITTYCNSVGQKEERVKNEGGRKKPFKCYVTTKRGGTDRERKRRQQEQMQRGSQAVHFRYSKKASAHKGVCAPYRLFFFLLFHPLSFSFSYKILQSGMQETTTLCPLQQAVNTFQNQLLLKLSNKYKRKKKISSHPPRGEQVNAFHSTNMHNVSTPPWWVATSVAEWLEFSNPVLAKRISFSKNVTYSNTPSCAASLASSIHSQVASRLQSPRGETRLGSTSALLP